MINNLRLRCLNIDGNPIAGLSLKIRLDESKKYFPRLELLDGSQTKPIRFFDPPELPLIKNGYVPPDLMPLARFFFETVLPKLASPETSEKDLTVFYNPDAFMSISLSRELEQHRFSFTRVNRNLCRFSTTKAVTENLFQGPLNIAHAIKILPLVSVMPSMLVCDAIDMTPFFKNPRFPEKNARFVQLSFCGTVIIGGGKGQRYSFRRVFVVMVLDPNLSILNDMMTLLPELGKNVALSSSAAVNLSNEEELIDKVVAATHIKRQYAREALLASQGNPEAAVQAIFQGRANGTLKPEHFN